MACSLVFGNRGQCRWSSQPSQPAGILQLGPWGWGGSFWGVPSPQSPDKKQGGGGGGIPFSLLLAAPFNPPTPVFPLLGPRALLPSPSPPHPRTHPPTRSLHPGPPKLAPGVFAITPRRESRSRLSPSPTEAEVAEPRTLPHKTDFGVVVCNGFFLSLLLLFLLLLLLL